MRLEIFTGMISNKFRKREETFTPSFNLENGKEENVGDGERVV